MQNKDDEKKKVISESFVRSLYLFARAISEMKVIDEIYDFSLPFLSTWQLSENFLFI